MDYINQEANEFEFIDGANVILSEKATMGKSSLIKSLYYTLGFDIKQFPLGWNHEEMLFSLSFEVDGIQYNIIRNKDLFYLSNLEKPVRLKGLSNWLQEILEIELKLKKSGGKSDELVDVYPTVLGMPFYLDQDKSWDGYLFKKTSDTLNAYSKMPDDVLDYLLGISNVEILRLENKAAAFNRDKMALSSKKKNYEDIRFEFKQEVVENEEVSYTPLEVEEYNNSFLTLNHELSSLSRDITKITNNMLNNQRNISIIKNDLSEIEKLKLVTTEEFKNIKLRCSHCNSILTKEQSLTRLKLNMNIYDIQRMIDLKSDEVIKLEKQLSVYNEEIKLLILEQEIATNKLEYLNQNTLLKDYIKSESHRSVINNFGKKINKFEVEIINLESQVATTRKEIRRLRNEVKDRKTDIIREFEKTRNMLSKDLKEKSLENVEFYDFREIKGSGMATNKVEFGMYLAYMQIIDQYSIYTMPFAIDSFIKNETDSKTVEEIYGPIGDYFFKFNNQSILTAISGNIASLDLSAVNVITIEGRVLSREKYSFFKPHFDKIIK